MLELHYRFRDFLGMFLQLADKWHIWFWLECNVLYVHCNRVQMCFFSWNNTQPR